MSKGAGSRSRCPSPAGPYSRTGQLTDAPRAALPVSGSLHTGLSVCSVLSCPVVCFCGCHCSLPLQGECECCLLLSASTMCLTGHMSGKIFSAMTYSAAGHVSEAATSTIYIKRGNAKQQHTEQGGQTLTRTWRTSRSRELTDSHYPNKEHGLNFSE